MVKECRNKILTFILNEKNAISISVFNWINKNDDFKNYLLIKKQNCKILEEIKYNLRERKKKQP